MISLWHSYTFNLSLIFHFTVVRYVRRKILLAWIMIEYFQNANDLIWFESNCFFHLTFAFSYKLLFPVGSFRVSLHEIGNSISGKLNSSNRAFCIEWWIPQTLCIHVCDDKVDIRFNCADFIGAKSSFCLKFRVLRVLCSDYLQICRFLVKFYILFFSACYSQFSTMYNIHSVGWFGGNVI